MKKMIKQFFKDCRTEFKAEYYRNLYWNNSFADAIHRWDFRQIVELAKGKMKETWEATMQNTRIY